MRHSRTPEALIEQLPITVDYGLSEREAIQLAGFGLVDPLLVLPGHGLDESFVLGRIGIIAHLIRFVGPQSIWPVEAISLIDKMGLRSGIPVELYCLAAEHHHKQIAHPIVVPDHAATLFTRSPQFQCAHRSPDWQRSLSLIPADKFGGDYYRYLAFERRWS